MQLNDPHLRHQQVDGQLILLPDPIGWELLKSDPVIDNNEVFIYKVLWQNLAFVNQYPELCMGLFLVGPYSPHWSYCALLQIYIMDDLQRVHLERLKCGTCNWQGMTANPTDRLLYLGVPDYPAAIKKAWQFHVLPCPRCKGKLPRHPIWIEPLSLDEQL